jgi:hypothetical protein
MVVLLKAPRADLHLDDIQRIKKLELDELVLENPTDIGQEILVCLVECSTSLSRFPAGQRRRAPTSHRLILDNHLSHG